MIYTITTNPSLDYYLKINDLHKGGLNRSEKESYDAAGKGVNVSKVLNDLNISSIALGFLGGYNKDYYLDLLGKYDKIQPQFIIIEDNTRINVKIDGEKETSLNAKGPTITDKEFERFLKRIDNIYRNDFVVLSGNVQAELKDRVIDAMKELIKNGVKLILDTDMDIVEKLLEYHPYLVKATHTDVDDESENIIKTGKDFIQRGCKYFIYSSAHEQSYLFTKDNYYTCDEYKKIEPSFIGANDSMIAGLLFASLKAANIKEAFTYGNALALSLEHMGLGANFELINKLYDELKIKEHEY